LAKTGHMYHHKAKKSEILTIQVLHIKEQKLKDTE
jgi:hypothetical protein